MATYFSVPPQPESGGGDSAIEGALKDASLLNQTTPTIANAWDLTARESASVSSVDSPPDKVRLRTMRRDRYESVSGVDRRTKVDPKDFAPGGRFRGICKLFMYFPTAPDPYVGSGWLIEDDLVVTAGHCAHDLTDGLGYAATIKVYMGFNGPDSDKDPTVQMRYGKYAVVPSEWVRSAAPTYDVAMIRLQSGFTDFEPIKYTETPLQGNEYLGVVGYPTDKDGGNYMYQGFAQVAYNLENSQRMLTYNIDTYGGNSGSPVLRGDDSRSIGIHCYGGALNSASVIGPAGNILADYITALKIKETGTPGQMYITIPASLKSGSISDNESAARTGMELGSLIPASNPNLGASLSDDESKMLAAFVALLVKHGIQFPNGLMNQPNPQPVLSVSRKPFMVFPERILALPESDDPNIPPINNIKDGIPADQQSVPSVQFINFPKDGLSGNDLEVQKKLMSQIGLTRANRTTQVEQQVLSKLQSKALDSNDLVAIASYRAKCHDAFMRFRSSWFEAGTAQTVSKTLDVKKAEFHTELLKIVLQGFSIPTSIFGQLERVLQSIGDGITAGSSSKSQNVIFWTELVRYDWEPTTKTSSANVMTVYFQSTEDSRKYMLGKNSIETVHFDLQFSQYEARFNEDIFTPLAEGALKDAIEKGKQLMKEPLDVPL